MYRVRKREGELVDFNIAKISSAITKAFEATGTEYNESVIDFLSLKVTADFQSKIEDGAVSVEDIQDSVEAVLSRGGYEDVYKRQPGVPAGGPVLPHRPRRPQRRPGLLLR